MQRKRNITLILAWLLAAGVAAVLGSIVQTQFNLAAVATLDGPVPTGLRIETTLLDIAGFAPGLALIVATGFGIAFPVAAGLARRWAPGGVARAALFGLAGGAAVWAAIFLMNTLLPMTPVAATRQAAGLLLMVAAGTAGGVTFAALAPARRPTPVA
ncbi:hypothetical protein [Wenzhouxiangella sp. XN24]|uniref:hypothetical protein n=1 Tax=Wenzhouxiangella sp. XN24 TaxID=2713569 RepID=UPI001F0F78BB|nr:hypothetical protein [Wenzhouxiangella sp. XN24]